MYIGKVECATNFFPVVDIFIWREQHWKNHKIFFSVCSPEETQNKSARDFILNELFYFSSLFFKENFNALCLTDPVPSLELTLQFQKKAEESNEDINSEKEELRETVDDSSQELAQVNSQGELESFYTVKVTKFPCDIWAMCC